MAGARHPTDCQGSRYMVLYRAPYGIPLIGATMLVIDAPRAAVVSTTEVKNDVRGAFKMAEEYRVYVTKDGQPIGGIISMAMMRILEDALENLQIAGIATDRLAAVRAGADTLLDADEFFARADAAMTARAKK